MRSLPRPTELRAVTPPPGLARASLRRGRGMVRFSQMAGTLRLMRPPCHLGHNYKRRFRSQLLMFLAALVQASFSRRATRSPGTIPKKKKIQPQMGVGERWMRSNMIFPLWMSSRQEKP